MAISPSDLTTYMDLQELIASSITQVIQGIQTIEENLDDYLTASRRLGFISTFDPQVIQDLCSRLVPSTQGTSNRFALVTLAGEPVLDEGVPITFRNKMQILRSPRYRDLIKDISTVRLKDQETGAILDHQLEFGSLPGRPRANV